MHDSVRPEEGLGRAAAGVAEGVRQLQALLRRLLLPAAPQRPPRSSLPPAHCAGEVPAGGLSGGRRPSTCWILTSMRSCRSRLDAAFAQVLVHPSGQWQSGSQCWEDYTAFQGVSQVCYRS
uniref:Uncharacterized protein n=1 Tax=Setaria viridis TaxID=4556 RepID=A0A4U6UCA5_SETVI|nr:hypothetical protein SEVIR_5G113501v2 [Setaria viridis]TKW13612.1 hypothetical protein SEVIR_5G113501v2 [Setaria viridis]